MTSLVDFLTARLAEDEVAVRAASPAPWQFSGVESVAGGTLYDATRRIADVAYEQPGDHDGSIVRNLLVPEADANGAHIARHDPARVLAEVAAKRAIVAIHEDRSGECSQCRGEERDEWDRSPWPCPTLRHLAAVYADHPDYDESWRP